ncbi:unnamed protein product [Effrenium voratum]|nr:unnamed protein product [Effrenium voratum]
MEHAGELEAMDQEGVKCQTTTLRGWGEPEEKRSCKSELSTSAGSRSVASPSICSTASQFEAACVGLLPMASQRIFADTPLRGWGASVSTRRPLRGWGAGVLEPPIAPSSSRTAFSA